MDLCEYLKFKGMQKKSQTVNYNLAVFLGAQNKTRTCTPLRAPAPQAGVSTNFTIWARKGLKAQWHKGTKA
jgi:hypothetical protein